jgi:hypothetical protein
MGCDIVVGKKDKYGYVCATRSKHAFGGSWHYIPAIGDGSPGFRMLLSAEGTLELSECIGAIEQMRVDIQRFDRERVADFNPIMADVVGRWVGRRWRHNSRSQFLYMGLKDPKRTTPGNPTLSEVKTIIKTIVGAVDWAIVRFGKDQVVVEIS